MAVIKSAEYNPTHKQLVSRIARWFKVRHQSSIVMAELSTVAQEIPDVIVWQSGASSVLVECKVSRADFLSDKGKFFRRQEDYGMGDKRYYAAPAGLINADELPEGWGLLEVGGHRVREIVEPKRKEANKSRECMMLMSALRRLEISTAVFVRQEPEVFGGHCPHCESTDIKVEDGYRCNTCNGRFRIPKEQSL